MLRPTIISAGTTVANTPNPLDKHLFPSYIHIVCIVNVNYAERYSKSHSGVLVLDGEILIFNESAFHTKQLTFILQKTFPPWRDIRHAQLF